MHSLHHHSGKLHHCSRPGVASVPPLPRRRPQHKPPPAARSALSQSQRNLMYYQCLSNGVRLHIRPIAFYGRSQCRNVYLGQSVFHPCPGQNLLLTASPRKSHLYVIFFLPVQNRFFQISFSITVTANSHYSRFLVFFPRVSLLSHSHVDSIFV